MKKVMISQPRYLPSVSYLNRIKKADVFIVLDSVQRVSRGYENRNEITDLNGIKKWLTIPIKSNSRTLIKDTITNGMTWKVDHVEKVHNAYRNQEIDMHYGAYLNKMKSTNYLQILTEGLVYLKGLYGIDTEIILASTLSDKTNGGIGELVHLTKAVGGDTYISGPTCLEYGFTHEYANDNELDLVIDDNVNHKLWIEQINSL